ncbi:carbonic anhydrase [Tetragenococcus koreensis]|nr:carbonic anhydrase [Tetragenococcus koreensis]
MKKPRRFTEKIQWYKVNYRNPLLTVCADKYMVREYVKMKGLAHKLTDLYFVTDDPTKLKIEDLPNNFIIKTTNGSGTNIICKDKFSIDINNIQNKLNNWLNRDIFAIAREWSYKDIKPKVVVEEYLEDTENSFEGINDYKFFCFNGKPCYVVFDIDRHSGHKRNIYDIDWNYIDVNTDRNNFGDIVPKPEGYEEMVNIAKILSEDFPFVRVDLYYVNKKVYFGELTFYPWSGYVQFNPDKFDLILGEKLSLPTKNS